MKLRRSVVEQEGHVVADGGVVDEVVVVQHEGDLSGLDAQLVDQGDEDILERPGRRVQEKQCRCGGARARALHCVQHVGPEPARVAVTFVERQPGHRAHAAFLVEASCQLRQEGRLSETRWSRHHGQGRGGGTLDDAGEATARDQLSMTLRNEQLGLHQEVTHRRLLSVQTVQLERRGATPWASARRGLLWLAAPSLPVPASRAGPGAAGVRRRRQNAPACVRRGARRCSVPQPGRRRGCLTSADPGIGLRSFLDAQHQVSWSPRTSRTPGRSCAHSCLRPSRSRSSSTGSCPGCTAPGFAS